MPSLALAPERSPATIESTAPSLADWLGRQLFSPVSIAPLAAFRIVFGLLLLRWSVWVYFDQGLIETRFVEPRFLFSYYGLEWVRPWAGIGMHLHFAALGLFAFCVGHRLLLPVERDLVVLGTDVCVPPGPGPVLASKLSDLPRQLPDGLHPGASSCIVDGWLRPDMRSRTVPAWCLWRCGFSSGCRISSAG